ncbi:MAG: Ig domain protein group 2 domain protein, partial [Firmicutes bacterium]|nr:Ig domain protein group 2 domain protein [Bacillota bacterium]
ENRTANYHGVGYDFGAYVNKHITLRVKFDIKTDESGTVKATFKSNVGYNSIASVDATAGTWYSMESTYPLDNTVTSAFMYIEHSVGTAKYTLDNVKITIDSIGDKIPVSGVALNQDNINLNIGQTANLTATISPNTADNKNVSWSSDHTSVATVANGVVSAVSAGTATITVTTEDGSKTATCAVTVSSSVQLVLNYGTVLLQSIGATKTAVTNVSGTTTWTSSDPAVATVAGGVITAVSNGSATVTASVGGSTASCNVIVADNIVLYEDFESGTNLIPNQGDWAVTTEILTDEASAYNGGKYLKVTNKNLYNGNLITLDNTAGITAANYVITSYVKAVGANVGVQYFHDNSALGYTIASVTATPTEWAKLESSVLTVAAGSSLVVRIITDAADSTDKTAYYMDSIYITRTPDTGSHPITGVTLNKSVLSLNKSASETLLATIAPVNYSTSGTIHWTSSNSSIAMVDSTGKVTAVASGTAIIYAETAVDGASTTAYTAQCEVTVTETVSVPVLDLTETLETTNPFDAYKSIGNFGNTGGGVRAVTGSAISPVGYKSDKCLQITGTADWHGISYWINNTNSVEVTYTFSARVKLVSGADTKVRIQTSERVHNDTDPYKEDIFNISADSWTLVSTTITIPAGVSISMELKPTTSNELIFLVDDIHISN